MPTAAVATHRHPSVVPLSYRRLPEPDAFVDRPPSKPSPHAIRNGQSGLLAAAVTRRAEREDALKPLAAQIHALVDGLCSKDTPVPAFARAVQKLQLERNAPLQRDDARALARALKALPATDALSARQQLMRAALRDLTRAAEAEALLLDKIEDHAQRQAFNTLPGALQESSFGVSGGVGFGLTGALSAGLNLGASNARWTATFDDQCIATVNEKKASAEAAAKVGLPAGVGVEARLGTTLTHGTADVAVTMADRVHELAHASVKRRLGGGALRRMLKRVVNRDSDPHAKRISRALAWQPRLQMLIGSTPSPPTPAAFHPAPPAPIDAMLDTVGATGGVSASYGVGALGVTADASTIEFNIDLPLRITDGGEDAEQARQDPEVRKALDQRVSRLLDGPRRSRSPALAQVQAIRGAPAGESGLASRREALARLEDEFNLLEALAQRWHLVPQQAKVPLASLLRDWNGKDMRCEPALIGMLDTVAWLQAAPPPGDAGQSLKWQQFQEEAQALADRIHATPLPHDRRQVHRATHAFRAMVQRIATRQAKVRVGAQWPLIGLGAEAIVKISQRKDPNPLREGVELELSMAADATPSAGALFGEALRLLSDEMDALPVPDALAIVGDLKPLFPTTGNARLGFRFLKPAFQNAPGYPREARGFHLQSVRVSIGASSTFGVEAPIPVAPGVNLTVGGKVTSSEQIPLCERICDGTLTGLLLRYTTLRERDTDEATTWAELMAQQGPDVDRLADALARADSVPAQEARYWLLHGADQAAQAKPSSALALLDTLKDQTHPAMRRAQVHALFKALTLITDRVKRASPLIGPAVLSSSPLR